MSAFTLRVSDGARSYSLTGGDGEPAVVRYVPLSGDGGEIPIDEPCRFIVEGKDNARALRTGLKRLFINAKRYAAFPVGNRVFVYFQAEDDEFEWRSPLYDGDVMPDIQTLDTMWAGDLFEIDVEWRRAPWWERGDREEDAPLSNNNGTDITDGLLIYNHDDYTGGTLEEGSWLGPLGLTASESVLEDEDGHDNWGRLNEDAIEGDLPAPARILIENTYATNTIRTAYIGHYLEGTAEILVLEGENAIGAGDVEPGTPDPDLYSGGQYKEGTITNSDTEQLLMTWVLDSDLLTEANGRAFRVMIRLADAFDGVARLFWQLQLGTTSVLWKSDKVRIDDSLHLYDLGNLTLPPLRHSERPDAIAGLELSLWGQSIGLDGDVLKVDYLYLLPMASYRRIEAVTGAVAENEFLVDDGINRSVYEINTSGQEVANYVGPGEPVMLVPGVVQTLYVLLQSSDGTAPVLRTSKLYAKYRRRRSSL